MERDRGGGRKWGNRMEKTDILKKRWSCTDGERQGRRKKMGRQWDGKGRAGDGGLKKRWSCTGGGGGGG